MMHTSFLATTRSQLYVKENDVDDLTKTIPSSGLQEMKTILFLFRC